MQKEIAEAMKKLGHNRIQEVIRYWNGASKDETMFVVGTNQLIDDEIELAENAYSQLPMNFESNFNLMVYYKEKNPQKYNHYRKILKKYFPKKLEEMENWELRRKVAFFIPHTGKTGGMKMIFKQIDTLRKNGYEVSLFYPYKEDGIPYTLEMFDRKMDAISYCNDEESMEKIADDYDIAIAPVWDYTYPLSKHFKKTFYYSQGDYTTFSNEKNDLQLIRALHSLPIHVFGVSSFLANLAESSHGRKMEVIPCDINLELFKPGEKFERPTILVVGKIGVPQKRIKETLQYLIALKETIDFDIIWITPDEGDIVYSDQIVTVKNPTQEELAEYFRKSTIFVTASGIEAFSLPPLEAMASGTAVVAADSGGNREYCIHRGNSLIFKNDDWGSMISYIVFLLQNEKERNILIENGLNKAQEFSTEKMNEKFIQYFNREVKKNYLVHFEK